MRDADVVVIGSGAGGLTAAVALARAGKRVVVLEQHYLPGGWCHSFPLGGHSWSPGVHYIGELGPGARMRAIYEGLGIADDLVFHELNPDGFDRVRMGPHRFDIPAGKERFAARLEARFPSQGAAIRRYLDVVERMADELAAGPPRTGSVREVLGLPSKLRHVLRYGLRPLARLFDQVGIRDPLLRGILAAQAGDYGLPPSQAPAVLHAAVAQHYFGGGFYPRGGGRAIPKAYLRELRRRGGEIRVRAEVERILLEGRRAIGVRLADGTELRADQVISNADPEVTYGRLIGRDALPWWLRSKLDRTRWGITAISLFLAVDLDLTALGMDSGNVWIYPDANIDGAYRAGCDPQLLERGEVPGLFLTATSLKDPTKQRGSVHTLEAFCFVAWEAFARWAGSAHEARPEGYAAAKEAFGDRMLRVIDEAFPGVAEHVVFREVGTPLTNVHYCASTRGALYGTEKSMRQLVPPLAYGLDSGFRALTLCGASTLGHGVAGATLSGLAAAAKIAGCRSSELLESGASTLRTVLAEDVAPSRRRSVA